MDSFPTIPYRPVEKLGDLCCYPLTRMGDSSPSSPQQEATLQRVPPLPVIDLSKPRYDQGTYVGRAKHFFETANPVNIFVSRKKLEDAVRLVKQYK